MRRSRITRKSLAHHVMDSFNKQGMMKLLGARISWLDKGLVEISTHNRPKIGQQDGFVHAGAMASLADSAGGYAVLSLLPPGSRVLSVEVKMNFTRPALGDLIRGRGRVRKLGRTLAVCELEVLLEQRGRWVSCAWGSQTVYCIRNQPMTVDSQSHAKFKSIIPQAYVGSV